MLNKEVVVDLSPAHSGVVPRLSCSPFDEIRAQRDLYYTTTTAAACEARPLSSLTPPDARMPAEEEADLAKDLREMDFFRNCCASAHGQRGAANTNKTTLHTASGTRQAASITRASRDSSMHRAAQDSRAFSRRQQRSSTESSISTVTGEARTDRLSALRAQLQQYLHRDPVPPTAASATALVTHSPSYDRDIALSKSPSTGAHGGGAGEVCPSPLFARRASEVGAAASSSPPPSLLPPAATRTQRASQTSTALFASTPSPSPEAARTAPEPHRDARLSSVRVEAASASQASAGHGLSRSLGYSSGRPSVSVESARRPSEAQKAGPPISVLRRIRCGNCLVEDELIVSHPSATPSIEFCPFCGYRLHQACIVPCE